MSHITPKVMFTILILAIILIFTNKDKSNVKIQEEVIEKIEKVEEEYENPNAEDNDNQNVNKIIDTDDDELDYNPVAEIKEAEIDKSLLEEIRYEVTLQESNSEKVISNELISMRLGDRYSTAIGITTFRGNTFRDSASYGHLDINEEKLEIIWKLSTGSIDGWTGVGWNGQPSIVQWDDETKELMNIYEDKKEKTNLKEVIYGTLDGNIYFIDLDDGKYTRNSIRVPASIKGSISVDPRGYPLLYAGQGLDKAGGKVVECGYRIFSLINQEKLYFINGIDKFAYRKWPAFDSTALIDEETDTMFICGENGLFYKIKLNTDLNLEENKISVNPQVYKYRYKISGNKHQGIENSVAMYKNLAYFADNGGWLQCIDINEMKPVWIRNITDDTDSTIVIEEDEEGVFLYTGCEVDKQGEKGNSYLRKIDALSGALIWEIPYACDTILGDRPNNGGLLATPVVGKYNLDNLVIFNIARCEGFNSGIVVALDKETGVEIWRLNLTNYSWSSPVAVYTEEGTGYIVLCDSAGNMFLLEGTTGNVLDKINLGANVEGSPAIFENMIVVGTRGQRIYGVKIR